MHLEQNFVVPLPVEDARKILAEVEKVVPDVPGVSVCFSLDAEGRGSTRVRVVGDLGTGGVGGSVLADVAARLVRQYAGQLAERATAYVKAAKADQQAPGPAAGGTQPATTRPATGTGSARRGGDVWGEVTDPIGTPGRATTPARFRRPGPALPVSARDVVAVVGAAVAFTAARKAVQRRRRASRRAGPSSPGR